MRAYARVLLTAWMAATCTGCVGYDHSCTSGACGGGHRGQSGSGGRGGGSQQR